MAYYEYYNGKLHINVWKHENTSKIFLLHSYIKKEKKERVWQDADIKKENKKKKKGSGKILKLKKKIRKLPIF